MVELLLRAIRFVDNPLSHKTTKAWHKLLFPTQPLVTPMIIREYRNESGAVTNNTNITSTTSDKTSTITTVSLENS